MARFIKRCLVFGVWCSVFGALLWSGISVRAQDASTLLSAPKLPPYKWFASTDPKHQNDDYVLLKPGETRRVALDSGVLLRLWSTAGEPQNISLDLQNANRRIELFSKGKAKFGELYQKAWTWYPTQSTPAAARALKDGAVLIATNHSKAENKWFYQAAVREGNTLITKSYPSGKLAPNNEENLDWERLDAALKTPTLQGKKLFSIPQNKSGSLLHIASGSARSQKGKPIPILKVQGEGAFVGLVLDIRPTPGAMRRTFAFLEGNETLIADGRKYEGTGAEDFFNSAWYYPEKPFSKQYHGMSFKSLDPPRVTAYRWMIPDAVSFKKSFQFDFEHGNGNRSDDLEYRWVAFWYQKAPFKFEIKDELLNAPGATGSTPGGSEASENKSGATLWIFAALIGGMSVGILLIARRARSRGK